MRASATVPSAVAAMLVLVGLGPALAAPDAPTGVALSAEFATNPRHAVFAPRDPVCVRLTVTGPRERAGALTWEVCDFEGRAVEHGTLSVPGGDDPWVGEIKPGDHGPGYFEIHASLATSGVTIPRAGSRPAGYVSYGVLPAVAPLKLAHLDDGRFGVQGTNFIRTGEWMKGDPFGPLYGLLGADWVNIPRKWFECEPDRPGQWASYTRPEQFTDKTWEAANNLALLTCTEGLPAWAAAVPPDVAAAAKTTPPHVQAYPPKDFGQYADFMARVGAEQHALRRAQFPRLEHGYYQVHWEPDWHWKGSDEDFIRMYASAYEGLHRGDPQAVVLGAGYGVLATGVAKLEKLLPLGLGKYLDGIATHAYCVRDPKVGVPGPDEASMIASFRRLRELMRTYLRPGARLFQTEWGVFYEGVPYAKLTPEMLRQQAASVVRGHVVCLGEGADVTFLFYTADYEGEDGFGLCFNLTMPNPSFGATHVSPKPVFMAAAAMTRLLDGTKTSGPLDLGPGILAYGFRRGSQNLVAAWTSEGNPRQVTLKAAAKSAAIFDMMGRETRVSTPGGKLTLRIDGAPHYVLW